MLGLFALLAALTALGCGSGDDPATDSGAGTAQEGSVEPDGTDPDVAGADPGDVAVITEWVDALAGGDVEDAAESFALPSVAENGPVLTRIETREDAIAFNETLPCGAELIAAETTGSFTTATFRLLERPGGDCGPGTGGTAATSFVIEDGEISEWRRVPIGDEERPGAGPTGSTT